MAGTSSWGRPSSTDLSPPTSRRATVSIPTKEAKSAQHSGKSVRNASTKAEITESLIEPSAKIVAGFGIETIVLKDGTSFAGSVVKESAKTLE
jgi:hypothetical protein